MVASCAATIPSPAAALRGERGRGRRPTSSCAATKGGWAIELNSATLPRRAGQPRAIMPKLQRGPQDKAAKAWLSECLASANWLVKALDQRARTIVKVASEIVKRQQGFFEPRRVGAAGR